MAVSKIDNIIFPEELIYHYLEIESDDKQVPVIIMQTIRQILQTSVVNNTTLDLRDVPHVTDVFTSDVNNTNAKKVNNILLSAINELKDNVFYIYYNDNNLLGMMIHESELNGNYEGAVTSTFTWLDINFKVLKPSVGKHIKNA